MERYSAMKMNELLPTEMDLKGIVPSEISRRKTNAT